MLITSEEVTSKYYNAYKADCSVLHKNMYRSWILWLVSSLIYYINVQAYSNFRGYHFHFSLITKLQLISIMQCSPSSVATQIIPLVLVLLIELPDNSLSVVNSFPD